tara:strand:+ start:295 stop:765 length:471 start_codon:yes stop_codon:yes gene_type:complete
MEDMIEISHNHNEAITIRHPMVGNEDWRALTPEHPKTEKKNRAHDPLDLTLIESNGETFEIRCVDIGVSVERRLQRTVLRGGEGDDMSDEGSESAVYTIDARIELPEYRKLIDIFRGSQPKMIEPYEGNVIKVAFRSVSYKYKGRELKLVIIQDTV